MFVGFFRDVRVFFALSGIIILAGILLLSLIFGSLSLSLSEVASGLTSSENPFARTIVWDIRFPRFLNAAIAGACLAVAGVLLQGITRNPLADPTILGITSAAGLGCAITTVISSFTPQWAIALSSVGGALLGAGIIYTFSYQRNTSPVRLALAGVALASFFGAIIIALLATSQLFIQQSLGFLAGGFYGVGWKEFYGLLPYAILGLAAAVFFGTRLNILMLGDEQAFSLGVLTNRTRGGALLIASVLTAAAVSTAGIVSFVGLICPHIAKTLVGNDHRLRIPIAALLGALLVSSADLLARIVIAPSELPMGIITAGIGAPFLLYLVRYRI